MSVEQLKLLRTQLIQSGIVADLYPSFGGTTTNINRTVAALICQFLDMSTIINGVTLVNRRWSEVSRSPMSWQHVRVRGLGLKDSRIASFANSKRLLLFLFLIYKRVSVCVCCMCSDALQRFSSEGLWLSF